MGLKMKLQEANDKTPKKVKPLKMGDVLKKNYEAIKKISGKQKKMVV